MPKPREYVSFKEIATIKSDAPNVKGAFLIGAINPETGKFRPRYVGCSYSNLMHEIIKSSQKQENKTFDHYRIVKTKTDAEAWLLEAKTYHEFKEINDFTNEGHAKRPEGFTSDNLKCPFDGCRF